MDALRSNKPVVDCPALHRAFEINHRPDKSTLEEIAREAGLLVTQVESWFSRTRAKHGLSSGTRDMSKKNKTLSKRKARQISEDPLSEVASSNARASSGSPYPTRRSYNRSSSVRINYREDAAIPADHPSEPDCQDLPPSSSVNYSATLNQLNEPIQPTSRPSAATSPSTRPRKKVKPSASSSKKAGKAKARVIIQASPVIESSDRQNELLQNEIERYFVEVNLGVRPIQSSSPLLPSYPPALQEWIQTSSEAADSSALRPFAEAAGSTLYYSDVSSSPSSSTFEESEYTTEKLSNSPGGGLGSPIKLWQELPVLTEQPSSDDGYEHCHLNPATWDLQIDQSSGKVEWPEMLELDSTAMPGYPSPKSSRECLSRVQSIVWTDWLVPSQERRTAFADENTASSISAPPAIIVTSASPTVTLKRSRSTPS